MVNPLKFWEAFMVNSLVGMMTQWKTHSQKVEAEKAAIKRKSLGI